MSKRQHVSLTTKLACCLAELQMLRGAPFEREALKSMSAAQVVSLYNFDHAELHTLTANDAFWNLTPRLILDHRAKTKNDRRELRKNRKGGKAHKRHLTTMAAKINGHIDGKPLPIDVRGEKADRPKAIMPGSKASPWKRRFDGTVERRS